LVKDDVRPFVRDADDLEIWSADYFLNLIELIKFE